MFYTRKMVYIVAIVVHAQLWQKDLPFAQYNCIHCRNYHSQMLPINQIELRTCISTWRTRFYNYEATTNKLDDDQSFKERSQTSIIAFISRTYASSVLPLISCTNCYIQLAVLVVSSLQHTLLLDIELQQVCLRKRLPIKI